MLTVVSGVGSGHESGKDRAPSLIDEIVRKGARRMLAEALQAEVDAYIARFAEERDAKGRRRVVRNGYHEPREVLTSAGAIEVTVPRVNDKCTDPGTGERKRFSSPIFRRGRGRRRRSPRCCHCCICTALSSGDFVPALGQFLGSTAGLSPAVITKLTETWKAEQEVGVPGFLDDLRAGLKDGSFRPLPVRERKISKPGIGEAPQARDTPQNPQTARARRDREVPGSFVTVTHPFHPLSHDGLHRALGGAGGQIGFSRPIRR